jgi:hypothetical protein
VGKRCETLRKWERVQWIVWPPDEHDWHSQLSDSIDVRKRNPSRNRPGCGGQRKAVMSTPTAQPLAGFFRESTSKHELTAMVSGSKGSELLEIVRDLIMERHRRERHVIVGWTREKKTVDAWRMIQCEAQGDSSAHRRPTDRCTLPAECIQNGKRVCDELADLVCRSIYKPWPVSMAALIEGRDGKPGRRLPPSDGSIGQKPVQIQQMRAFAGKIDRQRGLASRDVHMTATRCR